MTEQQQLAILEFVLRRISTEALNTALGFDIDNNPDAVFRLLDDATQLRDAKSIECALMIVDGRTGDIDPVPTMIALLRAPWHFQHEGLALWLQWRRDPRAVEALYETALTKHAYLDYDNSYPLARKCTWALADIGTEDAHERLRRLAANEDPEIAGYAQKRLDNWTAELRRKGLRRD